MATALKTTYDLKAIQGVIVLLAILSGAGVGIWFAAVSIAEERDAAVKCFNAGYPEMRMNRRVFKPTEFWCYKRENATDVVRRLDQ